jgi:hypothetical protein
MRLPVYAYAGLGILALSEVAMFAHLEPFWSWHTPIAWTGYILLADGIIFSRRQSSWLTTNRREFGFLAALSILFWLVFEGYNLLIRNWHYVGLPENLIVRYAGYAWAFATIWPGIFETAELVDLLRGRVRSPGRIVIFSNSVLITLMAAGAAMLVWPFIQPSPYLAAPIWLGFILLLDPLNHRLGAESLIGDFSRAGIGARRLVNLIVAGFVCGVLWEFWNYWSHTKWIYSVPFMTRVKIFEMPLPGYFGFPAFALECFTMYVFVRSFVWRGKTRPIGL